MPSRQDQLHSYQFSVQRVIAALVMRETDPAQSPFRRVAGATVAGAIVAALALAGAAVYGVYAGGSGDWQTEGQVIIEKESGSRYVFYKGDGKLHPVINYASALLIADAAEPKVLTWSHAALDAAERGAPMGIAGAPDSLPDIKHLLTAPWTICSQRSSDTSAATRPQSVLLVGGAAQGGRSLVPAGSNAQPDGLLVATPDGKRHLVYNNHRYQFMQADQVLRALLWSTKPTLQVPQALINALPAGPDLRPLQLTGRGGASTALPGAKVGQVYKVTNPGGAVQYAVALADGLADITEAQADLLSADPGLPLTPDGRPADLAPTDYGLANHSKVALPSVLPFATPPEIRAAAGTVCVSIPDAGGANKVVLDPTMPDLAVAVTTPARTANGTLLADQIVVPPGRGVLVEALASPGAPGGALSIVTDLGIRYPLASRDLIAKLGYGGVTPAAMPAEVVALVPAGPALDPAAARQASDSRK